LCIVVLVGGCTLTLAPAPETKVQVENSLTNLSVDVNGTTTAVDAIDLQGIYVGDAYFDYVQGGQTSAAKVTTSSGNVTITIDSAYIWTKVLGVSVKVGFKVTTSMSTTITKETTNTILMDHSTASALIGSLAKKLAK
jgi:maltoporin